MRAYNHLRAGEYLQAIPIYEEACPNAVALTQAGRCWNNLASSYFSIFRYREALRAYLEARRCSRRARDWANLINISTNLSSLYVTMGDLSAAAAAAEQGMQALNRQEFPGSRTRFLIQLGIVRARQDRIQECAALMGQAIDVAYRENDFAAVAQAWDHLGEEYLLRNELIDSDAALTEAFRIRKLHRLAKLDSAYWNLGRLRLAQGDLRSATHLLDEAVKRQEHPDSLVTSWNIYHTRGQVRMAEGRTAAALADFQRALDLARNWRLEVVPADYTRVSSEVRLQQIYSSYIEAGNRLYFATHNAKLARETFRAAEENRAASLRALVRARGDWHDALPSEYWQTLAQFHAAEVALLRGETSALREQMRQLRLTLLEIESKAGWNGDVSTDELLDRTQKSLPTNTALLSFHLAGRQSFLWAITRERFRVYQLPRKSDLSAEIARYAESLRAGYASAPTLGRQVYRSLFADLEETFLEKSHWVLALDEQLFRVPFGALEINGGAAGPVYLAERHSIRIATSAVMMSGIQKEPWTQALAGKFIGMGDAIYNTADPRWSQRPPDGRVSGPALTRLAGAAREIESCSRAWNSQPGAALLLAGADASPARLRSALSTDPSVVHIASHFLQSKEPPRYSMIALSLAASGNPQLLSPLEIVRLKIRTGLVVLSGCSSGEADVLPGSGLMGLTRAWLAAGARAVVASHWPTPDDRDGLFVSFYRHLRTTPEAGPSLALQRAQLDMLRAGGWRSNPQYWATYFVVGDR
jgi:CHAT domain-containing protein